MIIKQLGTFEDLQMALEIGHRVERYFPNPSDGTYGGEAVGTCYLSGIPTVHVLSGNGHISNDSFASADGSYSFYEVY